MMRFRLLGGRRFALPALSSARGVLHPAPPTPTPPPFPPEQTPVKRFIFSVHRSLPPPTDLLKAPELPDCNIDQFIINIGDAVELEVSIGKDKLAAIEYKNVTRLKKLFEEYVEDAVVRRGLLWDKPVGDEETRWLLFDYKRITGAYPRIFTTYGLMVHLEEMPRPYWRNFLDFLSDKKAVVIKDWFSKVNTRVGISIYDQGSKILDHNMWCKGESDGSFDEKSKDRVVKGGSVEGDNKVAVKEGKVGLGKAGAVLWRGNQVYCCELYINVPCSSSVEAEAKAMYLQLKKGVPLQFLIACTDCMAIFNAIKGDEPNSESGGMYDLLRSMRGNFKGLVPRWVPRSEMKFIDGLLREKMLDDEDGRRRQRTISKRLIHKWSNELSGNPIFTIEGKNPPVKMPANKQFELEENCILEVEEEGRFDALCLVVNALRPKKLYIIGKKNSIPSQERMENYFRDSDYTIYSKSSCCIVSMTPTLDHFKVSKSLVVVLDTSVPKEDYYIQGAFMIYLITPEERKTVERYCTKSFGPMTFVAFHK